ncbi:MAG: hypothetical protein ACLUJG_06320 [Lawsonibacter sp.]
MSAEYIMASGNENVILVRARASAPLRRSPATPWTCPQSPSSNELTHLPVIVDPSHATGVAWLVEPMALAASSLRCGRPDHRGTQRSPHALCGRGPVPAAGAV